MSGREHASIFDLTGEPTLNPSGPDFCTPERNMVDSLALINIPDTTARGPVFISEVSLNNDAVDAFQVTQTYCTGPDDNVAKSTITRYEKTGSPIQTTLN
eukprot:g12726.t1 g12726   contig61:3489-3788(-)